MHRGVSPWSLAKDDELAKSCYIARRKRKIRIAHRKLRAKEIVQRDIPMQDRFDIKKI